MAGTLAKKDNNGKMIEVEDNIVCTLKTESGILGTLTASWTYSEEDNSTILYMEKAVVRIFDSPEFDIVINEQDGAIKTYCLGGIQTNDNQIFSGIPEEFISSILESRKPAITGEDGMKAVTAILKCLESSEIHKNVLV